uniref:Uncharacterized protein n=1 Tax=Clastoptera arizonana TaxID=38151 RepID=A0A1B6DRC7_9HEMI
MFRKKNELPPPPKQPTNEQILEDLAKAGSKDPIFLEGDNDSEDQSDLNEHFINVKMFLESNKNLLNLISNLEDKKENLLVCNSELQNVAEDIRQQALNALK